VALFQHVLDEATLSLDSELKHELERLCASHTIRITLAETVTGGVISHHLSLFEGHDTFFTGSVVCSSPTSYLDLCGIPSHALSLDPSQLCQAMAQGICTKMKVPVGIATTGTLNRLDTGVYEGTLYIGFSILGSKRTKRFELNGSLSVVQDQMTQSCFAYLKHYLTQAYEYQEEE